MKLLLVQMLSYTSPYTGAQKAYRAWNEALVAQGHTVRVVARAVDDGTTTSAQLAADLAAQGYPVRAILPDSVMFEHNGVEVCAVVDDMRLYGEVQQQIKAFEPTWTIVGDDSSCMLLHAALEVAPARVVTLTMTRAMLPFGPESFKADPIKAELFRKVAGLLCVSTYDQQYIRRWLHRDATVIHPPMFGTGPFPPHSGFDAGMVMMVNPSDFKGLPIFLGLARQFPDVPFGAVPTWGATQADRAALLVQPNVTVLPPSPDIDTIFAQTRVLLIPSLWGETFGFLTIEAMLRGIPVMASAVGGLPEAKLGTDYVLPVRPIMQYQQPERWMDFIPVVPEQDITPWQHALHTLLTSPAEYERVSRESRAAALAFVKGITVDPLVAYLEALRPAGEQASARPAPAAASGANRAIEPDSARPALSPARRALLAWKLAQKGGAETRPPAIIRQWRQPERTLFPTSFIQHRLWLLSQFDQSSPLFNTVAAYRLSGHLDQEAFKRSVAAVVARHEPLRTTFSVMGSEVVQVVHAALPASATFEDLTSRPFDEQALHVEAIIQQTYQHPFDLERGPLLYMRLLQTSAGDTILIFAAHHIVFDGWSVSLFLRELTAHYRAYRTQEPLAVAELPIQYADYACWQHEWSRSEPFRRQLAYWKTQLHELPAVLDLPADRPRPTLPTGRGARHMFRLPQSLTPVLKRLSTNSGTTLFMTLLGGFYTFLYRYSQQDDIAVGSLIAGRNRTEVEALIGCFLNILVLRARIEPEQPFQQLLAQIASTTLHAYDNQDIPFERLVEELNPERDTRYNPLFQVMFNLHNTPPANSDLLGLRSESIAIPCETSRFDLTLDMWDQEEGLFGVFEYSTDLFDATTIARMADHFQAIVGYLALHPQTPLYSVPLLSSVEQRLLESWSRYDEVAPEACIHQLFERQAELTPAALAIMSGTQAISYRELSARSTDLAHALLRASVRPGEIVVLMLPDGPEQVVALLAVLKAGAVFVCIDPEHPVARLQQIVQEVQPAAILAVAALLPRHAPLFSYIEQECHGQVLVIDAALAERAGGDATLVPPLPAIPVTPQNSAYVVYTSGSTGTPRGIIQSHYSFCQFIGWFARQFDLRPGKRIAQWASLTYDAAYVEIFSTLCAGATLCMAPPDVRYEPSAVVDWLQEARINLFQTVPSFCRHLLRVLKQTPGGPLRATRTLETLLLAGETLPSDLARSWLEEFPESPQLFNLYGPTETILATFTSVEVVDPDQPAVPVGRAIAGRQILVLDRYQRLVPIGVVGEIYIRSRYLTQGYFRQPEKTSQAFVQNPLSTDLADLVYRTGDRGSWLPDGRLVFRGRQDHQIKLRGIRVDLGEIETALARYPAVQECAVLVETSGEGETDQRLVAYIATSQPLVATTLRQWLKQYLPDYMIPTDFIALECLPRTSSGKLNRKALATVPRPEADAAAYVAPRTQTEWTVCALWQELLHTAQIGIHDDFFALGGHSLLVMQFANRLRETHSVSLPMRTYFETTTVASLAEVIDQAHDQAVNEAALLDQLLADVQQLSEEDLDALLAQRSSE